jgi:hypothetical protein
VTMSKSKRRKPSSRQRPTKPGARRAAVLTVTVVLVVGICAAVVLLRGGALGGTGSPLASPTVPGGQLAATAVTATASFQSLRGRWLRPECAHHAFEVKQKVLQLVVQRIVVEDHRMTIEHVVPSGPLRLQPEHHAPAGPAWHM